MNLGARSFPNGGRDATLFHAILPGFFDPLRVEKCGSLPEPQGKGRPKWGTRCGVQGKSLPLHVPLVLLVPLVPTVLLVLHRTPPQTPSAISRATKTPLADAWDREWVTPLQSPMT